MSLRNIAGGKGCPWDWVPTNGTLITGDKARKLKEAHVYRVAIDLDGASAQIHNSLRGEFDNALRGIKYPKATQIKAIPIKRRAK